MKTLRIIAATLLICCVGLFAFGCGCGKNPTTTEENKGPQTSYSFYVSCDDTEIVEIGKTMKITAKCGDRQITFASKNADVAEVSAEGLVTAKALGETVIEITAGENKRSVKINVVKYEYGAALYIGQDAAASVEYAHVNASVVVRAFALKDGAEYDGEITWSVTGEPNAKLAVNGKSATFSATVKGEYVVTATTADGATASVTFKVVDSAEALN